MHQITQRLRQVVDVAHMVFAVAEKAEERSKFGFAFWNRERFDLVQLIRTDTDSRRADRFAWIMKRGDERRLMISIYLTAFSLCNIEFKS